MSLCCPCDALCTSSAEPFVVLSFCACCFCRAQVQTLARGSLSALDQAMSSQATERAEEAVRTRVWARAMVGHGPLEDDLAEALRTMGTANEAARSKLNVGVRGRGAMRAFMRA